MLMLLDTLPFSLTNQLISILLYNSGERTTINSSKLFTNFNNQFPCTFSEFPTVELNSIDGFVCA